MSAMSISAKTPVALSGVAETLLWPLWNRAWEAKRRGSLLQDPLAIDLVAGIDYDFAGHFGRPHIAHAIRARFCDDLVRDYLARTAGNSRVIALAEGLETQLWRVDDGSVDWISLDLPEAIALRRRLLPPHPRAQLIEASALDEQWLRALPAAPAPFISMAGLLMYFDQQQVEILLSRLFERFPGAEVFFDTIPPLFSRKTLKGFNVTGKYRAPPMPWGIEVDTLAAFVGRIPGAGEVAVQTYADPFPQHLRLYKLMSHIRILRNRLAPGLVHIKGAIPAQAAGC